jgi:hypothetical protein
VRVNIMGKRGRGGREEEGRGKEEEGRGKGEEGRGKREEGRGKGEEGLPTPTGWREKKSGVARPTERRKEGISAREEKLT